MNVGGSHAASVLLVLRVMRYTVVVQVIFANCALPYSYILLLANSYVQFSGTCVHPWDAQYSTIIYSSWQGLLHPPMLCYWQACTGILQTTPMHTRLIMSAVHGSRFTIARSIQASFTMVAMLLPNMCCCSVSASNTYKAHCPCDCWYQEYGTIYHEC